MMLRVVPIYAALLALLFLVLSIRVIRIRSAERISVGAGRSKVLERRMRVQANFAEYVPFTLLLLAMAELRGAATLLIHALCVVLLTGRIAHAWGMSPEHENLRLRVAGMAGTFASIVGGAVLIAAT